MPEVKKIKVNGKNTFQKVHFHLAMLCAGITAFILLVMSCGYLFISEKNLKDNSFLSFHNDMNTVLSDLKQQSVITDQWLTSIESNGKYRIQILDNGMPFLFNERNSEDQNALFDLAWQKYEEQFSGSSTESGYTTSHTEFQFFAPGKKSGQYYACAGISNRNSGTLRIMILMPQTQLQKQIKKQRSLFAVLDALAIAALLLFSWYFTKKLLQPLERNQKQQSRFIAAASHELRTPLAVILSCASACKDTDDVSRTRFLDSIRTEGHRMSRLIDELLLLTSADNHAWKLQIEPVESDTLLLEVFEAFEPIAAGKNIRLSVELPDTLLPPCLCDQERIRQVLAILLHNALSYTPEHGSIRLSLSFDGQCCRFMVADNGIGIPDEEKPHIFERFYRADQSRSQKDHFGLGLSIASEIIEAHHGRLLVSDTPGGGSTFTVVLACLSPQ